MEPVQQLRSSIFEAIDGRDGALIETDTKDSIAPIECDPRCPQNVVKVIEAIRRDIQLSGHEGTVLAVDEPGVEEEFLG